MCREFVCSILELVSSGVITKIKNRRVLMRPPISTIKFVLLLNHNFTAIESSFISDPRGAIFFCALATNR